MKVQSSLLSKALSCIKANRPQLLKIQRKRCSNCSGTLAVPCRCCYSDLRWHLQCLRTISAFHSPSPPSFFLFSFCEIGPFVSWLALNSLCSPWCPLPTCLDYRCVPPHPVYTVLKMQPRASCTLSKHSTNGATRDRISLYNPGWPWTHNNPPQTTVF